MARRAGELRGDHDTGHGIRQLLRRRPPERRHVRRALAHHQAAPLADPPRQVAPVRRRDARCFEFKGQQVRRQLLRRLPLRPPPELLHRHERHRRHLLARRRRRHVPVLELERQQRDGEDERGDEQRGGRGRQNDGDNGGGARLARRQPARFERRHEQAVAVVRGVELDREAAVGVHVARRGVGARPGGGEDDGRRAACVR
mmetsp:Transcript_21169/g.65756  ORF Transcript_21169/g.65756 Transcript_21169/m.65756 type:complete len:201 (-) Transcript_21169:160-762(-)